MAWALIIAGLLLGLWLLIMHLASCASPPEDALWGPPIATQARILFTERFTTPTALCEYFRVGLAWTIGSFEGGFVLRRQHLYEAVEEGDVVQVRIQFAYRKGTTSNTAASIVYYHIIDLKTAAGDFFSYEEVRPITYPGEVQLPPSTENSGESSE